MSESGWHFASMQSICHVDIWYYLSESTRDNNFEFDYVESKIYHKYTGYFYHQKFELNCHHHDKSYWWNWYLDFPYHNVDWLYIWKSESHCGFKLI